MPALARPWPLPRPLDQVQPLKLFPLVTNAPQQRGCPQAHTHLCESPHAVPVTFPGLSLHIPIRWARPVMNTPLLEPTRCPECWQSAGSPGAGVGPAGPSLCFEEGEVTCRV